MNPVGGSKIFIGLRVASKSEVTASDFVGQDWVEIGGLTNIGQLGDSQELVSQTIISSGRTRQTKGTVVGQVMDNTFLPIWNDPGQARFLAAVKSCHTYAFKVEWSQGCEDDPVVDLFYGLALPGARSGGDANSAQIRNGSIAVDSNVVEAAYGWDAMPYLLFLGGVKGVALDYNITESRFQDVFAAVPALAIDNPVARWNDQGPNGMFAYNNAGTARPLVKSDGLLFDGSNDLIYAVARQTLTETGSFVMPDLSDSIAGKGFTCTGATLDTSDNTLWVVNEGRSNSGDSSWRPSLVHMTLAGAFIAEVELLPNFPSMASLQGIAYDASDDTFWLASFTENLVRHVAKDGTSIGSFAFTTPNGITIEPVAGHLIICRENGAIRIHDKAGNQISAPPTSDPIKDQLYYDPVSKILYYSSDQQPCHIGMLHYETWQILGRLEVMPSVDAIEQALLIGSTMYVCNDAYMHSGASGLNEMVLFDVPVAPTYVPQPKITLFGRAKLTSAPAGSRCLLSVGDGNAYGGVALFGLASSTTSLRLDVNSGSGSGTLDSFTFTSLPDLTTVRAIVAEVDFDAKTAKLWIDGTQYGGTKTLVKAIGGVADGYMGLARSYAGATWTACTIQKAGFGTTIYDPAMRANLDQWLAT